MPDPLLEFDPVSEDAANSPLSIWNTASYMVIAFNPDAANQSVQWASSVDTEGALPASVKDENRTISITVECLTAAALRALQAKVTKISRERGTLKYTLPNSEVIVFDLLTRESFTPEFDVRYFIHSGADCTVEMSFTAKPYGRGAEVDLGDNVETTLPALIFTDTGVKGDIPGLGRLVVDNDHATETQGWLTWGIQSRYYSSDGAAALFMQAEGFGLSGSAALAARAGASGSGNTVARITPGTAWGGQDLTVQASGFTPTHRGTFRVYARVFAPNTNTGTVSIRLQLGLFGVVTETDAVAITSSGTSSGTPIENAWLLVDLGLITSHPDKLQATNFYNAFIQTHATVGGDTLDLDYLMWVPADEGSGVTRSTIQTSALSGLWAVHDAGATLGMITLYGTDRAYEGDYLRVPPAGAEGRTVRVIVKAARNTAGYSGAITDDPAIDDISARLYYTPRYLVVPSP